ncbi:hypothetical protein ABG768_021857, partial [Culter alburnus]
MATNILLSGNNYHKVSHLFNYMNMGFVGKATFYNIQDTYCLGAIKDMWESKSSAAIQRLKNQTTGRYKGTGVVHSWDIWHGAKNLAKKISAAAQQSGQKILLHWVKDIVNHFWFCCKKADTVQEFLKLWSSVLHHVTNEHEWYLGHCLHGSLPENQDKQWLESGSKAHKALEAVVLNKSLLRNIHRYLPFRSTCQLESFHNHLLMYASKRFSFSPLVYQARILLAALDYNHHKDRPPLLNKNGQKIFRRQFQKKTGRWTVYALKVAKDYSYIPDLQAAIVRARIQADMGMPRYRVPRPEDPRTLGLLPSVQPPSIDSILESH